MLDMFAKDNGSNCFVVKVMCVVGIYCKGNNVVQVIRIRI